MFQLGEVEFYKDALTVFFLSDIPAVSTPRRSPRLVQNGFDIFVHKLEEGIGRISNTAEVIHDVDRSAKLSKIIESLLKIDNEDTIYVPRKGIYWLRKGNKPPVLLKTDGDLETCKKEYKTGSIRIACTVVDVGSSSGTRLIWIFNTHSHPQSPQSIWAIPRIETSGQFQFLSMCRVLTLFCIFSQSNFQM